MIPKVALIGCGYWGSKYIPELVELHDVGALEFVGISDKDMSRMIKGPPNIIRTPLQAELITEADAAIIAVPDIQHYEVARSWISFNKHILLEKPVATKGKDAINLYLDSLDHKVVALPGHLYRYSKLIIELRNLIKSGELGEIHRVHMRWITPTIASNRHLLYDLLPHILDIFLDLFETLPTELVGALVSENWISLFFRWGNLEFTVEIGYNMPEKHRSIEVMGTKQWVSADVVRNIQFLYLTDPVTGARTERWVPPNNTLQDQIKNFIYCINNNKSNKLFKWASRGIEFIEKVEMVLEDGSRRLIIDYDLGDFT